MYRLRGALQTVILLLLFKPTIPMSLRFRPMKSIANHQSNVLRAAPEKTEQPIQTYQKPRYRYKPICNPEMNPGVDCESPTTCKPVQRNGVKQTVCNAVRPWQLAGVGNQMGSYANAKEEPFVILQLSGTRSTMAPYVGNTQPPHAHHDMTRCANLAKCEEHTWSH